MCLITRTPLLLLLTAILASCSDSGGRHVRRPISSVDFGAFHLSDALGKDMSHITTLDRGVSFTLCDDVKRPCGPEFSIANKNGVSISLWKTEADWDLRPMREKPRTEKEPEDAPMVQVSSKSMIDCCRNGASNWYPLSRLRVGNPEFTTFTTTSMNWPIVSCYGTMPFSRTCKFGFSVSGAFAEVSFGRRRHTFPSQSEIWALATAVDAKIRSESVPARPLRSTAKL